MDINEVLLTHSPLVFSGGQDFLNFFCLASVYMYPFTLGLVWWVYRKFSTGLSTEGL